MKKNICIICGKEFLHKNTKKTCSIECRNELQRLNGIKQFAKKLKYKKCNVCGKPIPRIPGKYNKNKRTCSEECSKEAQRLQHMRRREKAMRECVVCGTLFFNRAKCVKTCSRECSKVLISNASKEHWKNPEYSTTIINKNKKAWENEEKRKRHSLNKQAQDNTSIQRRVHLTKKENGSYKKSKKEDEVFLILKNTFPDVLRQYTSAEYPFNCDFYIPSINTYIEYQGFWMHGHFRSEIFGEFKKENKKHIKLYNLWKEKAKTKKIYKFALHVWTKSDPLKRQTAKNNNIKLIELWNVKEALHFCKNV